MLAIGLPILGSAEAKAKFSPTPFIDIEAGTPSGADCMTLLDVPSASLIPSWCSPLFREVGAPIGKPLSPINDVTPFLATKYKTLANGDILLFLRKNVYTASGDHFTATDVVYSFQRALGFSLGAQAEAGGLNIVTTGCGKTPATATGCGAITVINPYEVRINVTAPSPLMIGTLASPAAGVTWCCLDHAVMEAHETAADPWATKWLNQGNDASFGPYTLTNFVPSASLNLIANPKYWGPQPYFQKVIVKAVADAGTRLQLAEAGQASRTGALDWSQVQSAQQDKKLTVTLLPLGTENLDLNYKYGPFSNAMVRQAIDIGINREALAKSVYLGYATPNLGAIFGLVPLGFKPTTNITDNQVAKAKALLASAGYPNGFSFTVAATAANTGDYINDELSVLQSQLAAIGVTMNINLLATAGQFTAGRVAGQFQAYVTRAGFGAVAEPLANMEQFYQTPTVFDGFPTSVFGSLPSLFAQGNVLTGSKRTAVVKQAYNLWQSIVPTIHLVDAPQMGIYTSNITGYKYYEYNITYYDTLGAK